MTRQATITRTTEETSVEISVDLDGVGQTKVATGVGFFDHLLTSLSHHSLVDMEVRTEGDLQIDDHHTVEDTAMVLGQAFGQALGDRTGIERYGNATVPMDEALASCAIDVGGRPYAVIDITFQQQMIGNHVDTKRGSRPGSIRQNGWIHTPPDGKRGE